MRGRVRKISRTLHGESTMTMPRAVGLMFFVLFLGANAVEARARCPAGSYYKSRRAPVFPPKNFNGCLSKFGKGIQFIGATELTFTKLQSHKPRQR